MIPKPPPRDPPLGFLYLPPFRVQGVSIAGEATTVQVPEMDVVFDMGVCPRAVLSSKYCAISHGHMDHIGSLAYWCSQRKFQGMGTGTIVCDRRIIDDINGMMSGFVDLERQKTPYELVPLDDGGEIEVKNTIFLRAFHTEHTCPSIGYTLVEKRSKLRPEFEGFPQDKLREIADRGEQLTRTLEIPLITYIGDTLPGPHLLRPEVLNSKIIVTECTFFEPDHREKAKIGKHLHIEDIAEWLRVAQCETMVITHISRRTQMQFVIKRLREVLGREQANRIRVLMDYKTNKLVYEQQSLEAEKRERELAARSGE